jgi:hypothetical protein
MIQFDDQLDPALQASIYLISELSQLTGRLALTHASEPSAIHKIPESLDLVRSRVLNERKQVNTFDIECLSIRKFEVRKELFRKLK